MAEILAHLNTINTYIVCGLKERPTDKAFIKRKECWERALLKLRAGSIIIEDFKYPGFLSNIFGTLYAALQNTLKHCPTWVVAQVANAIKSPLETRSEPVSALTFATPTPTAPTFDSAARKE